MDFKFSIFLTAICTSSFFQASVILVEGNILDRADQSVILKDSCDSKPCSNGGTCLLEDGGFSCICDEFFYGQFCEKSPCEPNPCANGGTCQAFGYSEVDFYCTCATGYSGEMCENEDSGLRVSLTGATGTPATTTESDSPTCSFYFWRTDWQTAMKSCEKENKKLLCYESKQQIDKIMKTFRVADLNDTMLELWLLNQNCSSMKEEDCLSLHIRKSGSTFWHYFQSRCESDKYPFVCCKDKYDISGESTTYQSTLTGFTTQDPSVDCGCEGGTCEKDARGKLICRCPPDYGVYEGKCKRCFCGKDSTCTFGNGIVLFPPPHPTCICGEGYKESFSKCEGDCSGTPCKNGGTCRITGTEIACDCKAPYSGEKCEQNISGKSTTYQSTLTGFTTEDPSGLPERISGVRYEKITSSRITFNIIGEKNSGKYPTTHFVMQYYTVGDPKSSREIVWNKGTPYVVNRLRPRATYNFSIAAQNQVGKGPWFSFQKTMPEESIPEPPLIRTKPETVSKFPDTFEAEWDAPDDNGSPILEYEIRCVEVEKGGVDIWFEVGNESVQRLSSDIRSYQLANLVPDSYYKIDIRATNEIGPGLIASVVVKTARGKICNDYYCHNGGLCKIEDDYPMCYCKNGFTGEKCQVSVRRKKF